MDHQSARWLEYGILAFLCLTLVTALLKGLHHTLTITFPKIQESHHAIVNKLIDAFAEQEEKSRALFREEQAKEREACERRHKENLEAAARRQQDVLDGQKENRHMVANLVHETALHRAVVELATGLAHVDPPTRPPAPK